MRTTFSFLLLAALSFTGIQAKGADPTMTMETTFYRALARGDAATLSAQMHPALRELVDQPILEAWAIAARDKLGGHLSTTRLVSSRTQLLGGVEFKIESEVQFEHGTATGTMRFLDDRLVAFEVQSDQLQNWFQGPSRVDLYSNRCEAFIAAFISQDAEKARSLMHEALQNVVADGKLETMMQTVAKNGGPLQSATLRTHRMSMEEDRQALVLLFDIECERANGVCEMEIEFVGMQGHLISFDFQ